MTDHQLELYKQAVKEVVAESHGRIHSDMSDRLISLENLAKTNAKNIEIMEERLAPVYEFFNHMTWLKSFVIGTFAVAGTIAGTILAVKGLWTK